MRNLEMSDQPSQATFVQGQLEPRLSQSSGGNQTFVFQQKSSSPKAAKIAETLGDSRQDSNVMSSDQVASLWAVAFTDALSPSLAEYFGREEEDQASAKAGTSNRKKSIGLVDVLDHRELSAM